jgi:circadian clock protein KaiB
VKSARYHFRLFVAGGEPNSALARAALDEICSQHLEGSCTVETVDVLEDYQPALAENILVTPALIIEKPKPRMVIFGNLSDKKKVLAALQVAEENDKHSTTKLSGATGSS